MGSGRLRSADRRPVRGRACGRCRTGDSLCRRATARGGLCGRKRAGRHLTPGTGVPCGWRLSASSFATISRRCVAWRVEQSRITHQDPRCAAGSLVVAGAVALTPSGESLRPEEFLERLAEWAEPEDQSVADAVRGVEPWLDLTPVEAARAPSPIGLDPLRGIAGAGSRRSWPIVAWSLYAFLRSPDDYWTVVCTAIGAGGDTDTMAAIAGAMAGARGGLALLPGPLLGFLNDQGTWRAAELTSLACDCARIAAISRNPPPS